MTGRQLHRYNEHFTAEAWRLPDCATCKHFERGRTCPAFPWGIPRAFLEGDEQHRTADPEQMFDVVYTPEEE